MADLLDANLSDANLNGAKTHRGDSHRREPQCGEPHRRGPQGCRSREDGLTGADLTGCRIHGVSAWALKLETNKQQNLVITDVDEPDITVDNIEVARSSISCSTTRRFATSSTPSNSKQPFRTTVG
jgi:hypothetical protein